MNETAKLGIGFVGILVGFLLGLAIHVHIMQRTGGTLFDRPELGLLVAFGLCGGGAVLFGYVALAIAGKVAQDRKRAARKEKKRKKK